MAKRRPPNWPAGWPYWSRPKGGGGQRLSTGVPATPVAPVDPLSIYNDQFAFGLVNSLWVPFRGDLITVNEIVDGIWHVGADTGSAIGSDWFNALIGWLLGPMITGDCLMQTRLRVVNYAGDGPPPLADYRLGGPSVHDPANPPENYNHGVIGCLVPEDGPSYRLELKNNQNSVSNYFTVAWADINAEVDMALQYVGQICTYAAKLATESDYTVYRIVDRSVDGPLMPATKHWSPTSYSDQVVADVSLLVRSVRFSTPGFNGGLILPTS